MRIKLALLFLFVLMLVGWPPVSEAADRIGDWNGTQKSGTVTGASSYIEFYGRTPKYLWGDATSMAVLKPFDDETFTWATDSLAAGYSGSYAVVDWLSDQAVLITCLKDTVAGLDVWVQASADNSTWFDMVQLADSEGTTLKGTAIVDTIDLTNPVLSFPYIRFKWELNDPASLTDTLDYAIVKFIKP